MLGNSSRKRLLLTTGIKNYDPVMDDIFDLEINSISLIVISYEQISRK